MRLEEGIAFTTSPNIFWSSFGMVKWAAHDAIMLIAVNALVSTIMGSVYLDYDDLEELVVLEAIFTTFVKRLIGRKKNEP